MSNLVQIIAVVVSGAMLAVVIDLVRRQELTEEHSLIWLLCAVALLALSLWRGVLDLSARWLGIYYPPAVLLLVLVLFVFVASLYFSVVISRQRRQIERLVEELANLEARLRDVEEPIKARSQPRSGQRVPVAGEASPGRHPPDSHPTAHS